MHGDFPATDALYADPNERRIARLAAVIEGIGYRRWTRAEEIIEFAHGLDISRLGLAFCPSMKREAEIYADVLKVNGFEVVLGTEDHDSAHKGEPCLEGGLDSCNPVAQAELFNRRRTGLNQPFVTPSPER